MLKNFSNSHKKSSQAFTLVEMIVSLGIFAVVAVVALGALVRIITANQKAQSLQASMTNINSALEAMSREIRVGTDYHCEAGLNDPNEIQIVPHGQGPGNTGELTLKGCQIDNIAAQGNQVHNATVFGFKSSQLNKANTCNLIFAYRFINIPTRPPEPSIHLQKIEQPPSNQNGCTDVLPQGGGNIKYTDVLSSANVTVTDYRFGVIMDTPYPYVFIRLIGYAGTSEKERNYFDVQTMISSRTPQQ